MTESDNIKTIEAFLGDKKNIQIPDYQRGYRWTKTQIEKLLTDIQHFGTAGYPLQHITIKEEGENYIILDGQQRLTTICLILDMYKEDAVFSDRIKPKGKDTWDGIDADFISNARDIIEAWKKDNNNFNIEWLEKATIRVYKVGLDLDSPTKQIEFFSKINSNNIPLTNSEMIKALFVQKLKDKHDQRQKILREWDDIENQLQNDNFWAFISNDIYKADTRIDFLFDLIKNNKDGEEPKNTQYGLFLVYEDHLQKQKTDDEKIKSISDIWQKVKEIFSLLQNLYNDKTCYHLFGYLMYDVLNEGKDFLSKPHKDKEQELKDIIKKKWKNASEELEELKYENKTKLKIKKILLLFNVVSSDITEEKNYRFSFYDFKRLGFDIEHIHARNTKIPFEAQYAKKWYKENPKEGIDAKNPDLSGRVAATIAYLEEFNKYNTTEENKQVGTEEKTTAENKKLIEEVKKAIKELEPYTKLENAKDNETKIKQIVDKISQELETVDDDDFGNLCLLDAATNRGYGNSYFIKKQKIIMDEDLNGKFFPICTKRVFLNYYTQKLKDKIWGKEHKEEYAKALKECLNAYFDIPQQDHKDEDK